MNVPNETLDRWRAFAEAVRQTTITARSRVARGEYDETREMLQALHDASIAAAGSMEHAGARTPGTLPTLAAVPLALLSSPANRRYLKALEAAHAAAMDVDEERGYGREGAGPAAGMLEMLLDETREEVNGPAGLGEGATEDTPEEEAEALTPEAEALTPDEEARVMALAQERLDALRQHTEKAFGKLAFVKTNADHILPGALWLPECLHEAMTQLALIGRGLEELGARKPS